MCQLKAIVEQSDGSQKIVMEAVTDVNVTPDGVTLKTFFEEPLTVPNAWVQSIDFLSGSMILSVKQIT